MAGHNKWSKVKHKKAVEDTKKSKVFARLAREITQESRGAGGDRSAPGVRKAIERARGENMPSENIERAIARGAGGESGELVAVTYEAYGPGSCAMMIEGYTDNKNRTSADIKHILTKHGISLAEQGAASWAFQKTDGGWEATATIDIGESEKEKLATLVAALREHEDVEDVYTNAT